MYLTLPVPNGRGSSKVSLTQCLDTFVKSEVMEKTDAWYIICWYIPIHITDSDRLTGRHCPNCKTLRRATKQLSLSRLPPVLLIHLKRFQVKGPFTDKIETLVDFPLRSLDLTNYMPPPLPPGIDKSQLNGGHRISSDDPRAQLPPYKYDLYGVTNHSGNLSNGHCKCSIIVFVTMTAILKVTFFKTPLLLPHVEDGCTVTIVGFNQRTSKKWWYVLSLTHSCMSGKLILIHRDVEHMFYFIKGQKHKVYKLINIFHVPGLSLVRPSSLLSSLSSVFPACSPTMDNIHTCNLSSHKSEIMSP